MKFLFKLVLLFCIFPYFAAAQNAGSKNTKKAKPPQDATTVQPVRDAVIEEIVPSDSGGPDIKIEEMARPEIDPSRDYGGYKIAVLNKTISFIYRYNASTGEYENGIIKNNRQILPAIFKADHYNEYTTSSRILGIGSKYGVYDLENEKWIIPIEFDRMSALNSTAYIVSKGGFYGVLDQSNKYLVPLEWSDIQKIREMDNYAIVSKNSNKGILNVTDNKLTAPCVYSEVVTIINSTDFKVKKNNAYNIINVDGKPRFKNWYQELYIPSNKRKNYIVKLNDRMGIVDDSEKIILPIEYQDISQNVFNDGSFLAKNKNGKYGCVSLDGKITLPFEYDDLTAIIRENLKLAVKGDKYGLIQLNDGLPYEIIPCEFDTIIYSKTFYLVKKNHKFGLVDLFGKIITPVNFDSIEVDCNANDIFNNTVAVFIAKKDDYKFLISNKGVIFNDAKYKQILPLYTSLIRGDHRSLWYKRSNHFVYYKDGKAGVLDMSGKEITPNIFDDILYITQSNILVVKKGDKAGFYNLFTNKMILEPKYDLIFDANNKMYGQLGSDFYLLSIDDNGNVQERIVPFIIR
jgi:hypothetical protein